MPYTNAENLLPPSLLVEVQKYVQGEQIYIPRSGDTRLGWGMKNGTRTMLERRNNEIREMKRRGFSIDELADRFHLSHDSIRKILYSKKTGRDRITTRQPTLADDMADRHAS
jgi:Mor family transcriptional regulator